MKTLDRVSIDDLNTPAQLEWNKERVREIVDRIFVHQEDPAIDELIAEDFVPDTFGPMPPRGEGLRAGMRRAGAGISDPEFVIHDLIAEGDLVVARLATSGRRTGTFMGISHPASATRSTRSTSSGCGTGVLVEHWHEFDKVTLLNQLRGGAPR